MKPRIVIREARDENGRMASHAMNIFMESVGGNLWHEREEALTEIERNGLEPERYLDPPTNRALATCIMIDRCARRPGFPFGTPQSMYVDIKFIGEEWGHIKQEAYNCFNVPVKFAKTKWVVRPWNDRKPANMYDTTFDNYGEAKQYAEYLVWEKKWYRAELKEIGLSKQKEWRDFITKYNEFIT